MENKRIWYGSKPKTCDICSAVFTNYFGDCKTVYGPHGLLCPPCISQKAAGIGQIYRLNKDTKEWEYEREVTDKTKRLV